MTDRLGTDPLTALDVVIATVGICLTLLVLVRVSGPRSISTMSGTDVACVIALGAVVGRTTLLAEPTLVTGMIALVVLFALQRLLSRLERLPSWGRLLTRRPVVLMMDGEARDDALRRAGVSEDDLRRGLRQAGVTTRSEVRLVVLERTGQISVLRGDQPEPWLLADLSPPERRA